MLDKRKVPVADLRRVCDPGQFSFRTTKEVKPLEEVIGQERAVRAITFGLDMKSRGYNIFVTGIEGTGKSTIVGDIVSQHAQQVPQERQYDHRHVPFWCFRLSLSHY